MLLIGQQAEPLLTQNANSQSGKLMNMMAAKNFAIKLTDEALKVVRGERSEARSLADLAVGVSQVDPWCFFHTMGKTLQACFISYLGNG